MGADPGPGLSPKLPSPPYPALPDGRDDYSVLRDALMRIRLYGSPWWKPEWPHPAKLAHDALNAADRLAADDPAEAVCECGHPHPEPPAGAPAATEET